MDNSHSHRNTRLRRILKIFGVLLILLAALAVAGSLLAPRYLGDMAVRELNSALGRRVSLERVHLNPLTLHAELHGLVIMEADEADEFIRIDRVAINLDLSSATQQAVNLQRVHLDGVRIRMVRSLGPRFNFSDIIERLSPEADRRTGSSEPFPLALKRIRVTDGVLEITDHTVPGPFSTSVSFELSGEDISTRGDSRGRFSAALELDRQSVRLDGGLSLLPLRASGTARIRRIDLTAYAPYFADQLPLRLVSARAESSFAFTLGNTDGRFDATLSEANLELDDVTLRTQSGRDLLSLPQLHLEGGRAELSTLSLFFQRLTLANGSVTVTREEDGTLSLPASAPDAPPQPVAGPATPPPFSAAVEQVELRDWTVRFVDRTIPEAPALESTGIHLTAGPLATAPGEPVSLSLEGQWGAGRYEAQATIPREPDGRLEATGTLRGRDLPLELFLPLLAPELPVRPTGGAASLTADFTGSYSEGSGPALEGNATASMADLALADGQGHDLATLEELQLEGIRFAHPDTEIDMDQATARGAVLLDGGELAGFTRLRVEGVRFAPAAPSLRVRSLSLLGPRARVERTTTGFNLSRFTRRLAAASGNSPAEADSATSEAQQPRLRALVDRALVEKGRLEFQDHSVTPPFAADITELRLEAEDLSTAPDGRSRVQLEALLDKVARLTATGTAGRGHNGPVLDLELLLKGLQLPVLSPYTRKYLASTVDRGRLDLDSDLRIENHELRSENELRFHGLRLGERVEPADPSLVVDAPLELGLALLQDDDGDMTLNVPVNGDLDKPDFQLGSVVSQAIGGALGSIVSAPFSLLGALLPDLGPDELDHLTFAPGSAQLSASAATRLDSLVRILERRPGLALTLEAVVDREVDGEALLERAYQHQLRLEKYRELREQGRAPDSVEAVEVAADEEAQYLDRIHEKRVFTRRADSEPTVEIMRREVRQTLSVGYGGLRDLARQRIAAVVDHLEGERGIPRQRILVNPPELGGALQPAVRFGLAADRDELPGRSSGSD